jgi:hypothetical protein
MRNVIFAINITLDGCCDHTKMIADEEIHEYFTHLMRDVDLLVFGRKTYQLMVPFWPDVAKNHSETKAMNEFADTFDSINKIVFSESFDSSAYCMSALAYAMKNSYSCMTPFSQKFRDRVTPINGTLCKTHTRQGPRFGFGSSHLKRSEQQSLRSALVQICFAFLRHLASASSKSI